MNNINVNNQVCDNSISGFNQELTQEITQQKTSFNKVLDMPLAESKLQEIKNDKNDIPSGKKSPDTKYIDQNCTAMLDSITKIMGELQKLMAKQREQNSEAIVNNLQLAKSENIAAANEIKTSANAAYGRQLAGAITTLCTSVLSATFSFISLGKQANAISHAREIMNGNEGLTLDQALKLYTTPEVLSAIGKGFDSIGNSTKGILDARASLKSAEGQAASKIHEANAQDIQAAIEKLKEVTEGIKDVQRKALETMQTVSQNEVEVIKKLTV